MTELSFRLATLDDFGFLSTLETFQKNHKPDIFLKYLIEEENFVVAELDGQMVGHAVNDYLWGDMPFLCFLDVFEGFQGRGVASGLLQYMERLLYTRGHRVLYSSTMESNEISQGWHDKNGFKRIGMLRGVNFWEPRKQGEIFYRKSL